MSLQRVHYFAILFGALAASLPALSTQLPPTWVPYLLVASAICAAIATTLGIMSPSATASTSSAANTNGNSSGGSGPTTIETYRDVPVPNEHRRSKAVLPSIGVLAMLGMFALLLLPTPGCSWFSSREPQVVHGVADVVICILDHESEAITDIAKDCGGVVEADVVSILSAHKQAMARELGKPMACPAPSPATSSSSGTP